MSAKKKRRTISTNEQFAAEARKKHTIVYDYSQANFTKRKANVRIACPNGHVFYVRALTHLRGDGHCPDCRSEILALPKILKEEVIRRCVETHGNLYSYDEVEYEGTNQPLKNIRCSAHGLFTMIASNHYFGGSGCPKCGHEKIAQARTKPFSSFLEFVYKNIGPHISIDEETYVDRSHPATMTCTIHNFSWKQIPEYLIQDPVPRCNQCKNSHSGFSAAALIWLHDEESKSGIRTQNHINGGEYAIFLEKSDSFGRKSYKVDGYCKETNTVYEYDGDYWHGNLEIYDPAAFHPIIGKPYEELFAMTHIKHETIRKLGYTLVSIWDSQYRARLKAQGRNLETESKNLLKTL